MESARLWDAGDYFVQRGEGESRGFRELEKRQTNVIVEGDVNMESHGGVEN